MHGSYQNHLLQLGLLTNTYRKPKSGELPEFDDRTGTLKGSGRSLTPLGRLLLRTIDVLAEGEM
jgi:hypothetical protein